MGYVPWPASVRRGMKSRRISTASVRCSAGGSLENQWCDGSAGRVPRWKIVGAAAPISSGVKVSVLVEAITVRSPVLGWIPPGRRMTLLPFEIALSGLESGATISIAVAIRRCRSEKSWMSGSWPGVKSQ